MAELQPSQNFAAVPDCMYQEVMIEWFGPTGGVPWLYSLLATPRTDCLCAQELLCKSVVR